MIELIDYFIQMGTTALCTILSGVYMMRTGKRVWVYLMLGSGAYFLGDLYWFLYLLFYGETPQYSYVADFSWYTCYLVLFMIILEIAADRGEWRSNRLLWLIMVFPAAMCIFYLQWGDFFGNFVTLILRGLVMWGALDGLIATRLFPAEKRNRMYYIIAFLFCVTEYGTDTASCFWMGDTIRNPYFWFDTLLAVLFLLLPPALRKAVNE